MLPKDHRETTLSPSYPATNCDQEAAADSGLLKRETRTIQIIEGVQLRTERTRAVIQVRRLSGQLLMINS